MTAILLAAGVATAVTVVLTGVMSVSNVRCCGDREGRGKKIAKTIASAADEIAYVFTRLNILFKEKCEHTHTHTYRRNAYEAQKATTNKKKKKKRSKKRSKKRAAEKEETKKISAEERARREKKAEKKRLQKLKKQQKKQATTETTTSTTTTTVDEDDGWTTVSSRKQKRQIKSSGNNENVPPATSVESTTTSTLKTADVVEESVTDTVRIDARKVGAIVGKGGSTLHAIQDKTGVKIDTPSRKEDEIDRKKKSQIPSIQRSTVWATITIKGPKKGVKIAKGAITSIATKGFCHLLNPEMTEGFMAVQSKNLRDIIGPGGAFVKAIQKATETNIRIPRDMSTKSNDRLRVYVTGSKHNVREAKDAMKSLIKLYWSKYTHPNQTYQEVSVPEDKLGRVIGPKGQSIKSIQGDTQTKIHTPPTYSNNVIIVGTEAGIAKAVARIKKIVEEEPVKKSDDQYDMDDEE